MDYKFSYEYRMKTGVLLLLNCPKKRMKITFDLNEYLINEKFMGIKLIPEGFHFVSFNIDNEHNNENNKGFFIEIGKKKNVIKKYDEENEEFKNITKENENNYNIGINNLDFDLNLANYNNEDNKNWKDLINFINNDIINRVFIFSNNNHNNNDKNNDNNNNNEIIYTIFPKNFKDNNNKITINNIDKSILIKNVINEYYDNNYKLFLGEFQISFVLFYLLNNYESLMFWKDVINLTLNSYNFLNENENFFSDFFIVLYNQLRKFPNDFLNDNNNNNESLFLKRNFNYFFNNNDNNNKDNKNINNKCENVKKHFIKFLKNKFNYNIETEEERIFNYYFNNKDKNNTIYINNNDEFNDDLPAIVDQKDLIISNNNNNDNNINSYIFKEYKY